MDEMEAKGRKWARKLFAHYRTAESTARTLPWYRQSAEFRKAFSDEWERLSGRVESNYGDARDA